VDFEKREYNNGTPEKLTDTNAVYQPLDASMNENKI
jgi:hypothetical protein